MEKDKHARIVEEKQKKLLLMEEDLKRRCDDFDEQIAQLKKDQIGFSGKESQLADDRAELNKDPWVCKFI